MTRWCIIVDSFVDEYDYCRDHNMDYKEKDNLVQELEVLGFVNPRRLEVLD